MILQSRKWRLLIRVVVLVLALLECGMAVMPGLVRSRLVNALIRLVAVERDRVARKRSEHG